MRRFINTNKETRDFQQKEGIKIFFIYERLIKAPKKLKNFLGPFISEKYPYSFLLLKIPSFFYNFLLLVASFINNDFRLNTAYKVSKRLIQISNS